MPFSVEIDPKSAVLVSSCSGVWYPADVDEWNSALHEVTAGLTEDSRFQFLSDFYDYDMADQEMGVHKRMREVVPRFLAAHGFAVGFWRLYEATPPPASRLGLCTRVAHVHRDRAKMERYNELLGSSQERFFYQRETAREWLVGG